MSRVDDIALAKVRLEELLTFFGINTKVKVDDPGEERVELLVETDGGAQLIGHHGENLRALQHLVNMMLREQNEERIFWSIDVGGYKQARAEQIKAKAKQHVQQVIDSGEVLTLPPMPPFERRLVHLVVEETPGVVSESAGVEPKRHIIIKPE